MRIEQRVRNLLTSCLYHACRIGFLLLIQLVYIPIAFLAFPVAALSLFTTVAHALFVALGNPLAATQVPLTCAALKLEPGQCTPALFVIHPLQVLLAYLLIKYSDRFLTVSADGYKKGLEWLHRLLDSPS